MQRAGDLAIRPVVVVVARKSHGVAGGAEEPGGDPVEDGEARPSYQQDLWHYALGRMVDA